MQNSKVFDECYISNRFSLTERERLFCQQTFKNPWSGSGFRNVSAVFFDAIIVPKFSQNSCQKQGFVINTI